MKKENLKTIALISAIVVVTVSVIGAVVLMSGEHESIGGENGSGTEGTGNNTGGGENNSEGNENEGNYVATMERGYDVIIDSKGNYTAYIPVVLGRYGLSYIMDNLTLEYGNCTYKIENTTYGLALNITGRGHVMLSAEVVYTMYVENWKVVNTSGVDPSKGHPIVLSMSNISNLSCEVNKSGNITVVTGYNTTDDSFRDNVCWKEYVNNSMLSNAYPALSYPISVHSFVYVKSDKPVDIDINLYEVNVKGDTTTWELSRKFETSGWHYVPVETREDIVL